MKYVWSFVWILAAWGLYGQQTIGLFQNDSSAFNGYTLIAPAAYTGTYLIDNCGQVVNTWHSNYIPGIAAYLLPDGRLLRTARINSDFNAGGTGGRIELYSWEGDLQWHYNYSSETYHQHHDVAYLPNGNVLVLAWELVSTDEAIEAGRNPGLVGPNGLWPEHLVEMQPIGTDSVEIVWEWHLWDHIVQDFDPEKENYGEIAEHPELINLNYVNGTSIGPDWIHANTVSYHAGYDQIMISSRNFNEVWVIDHSTTTEEAAGPSGGNSGKGGDILYRWGNPRAYNRGAFENQRLFGQHDAQWIAEGSPGAGNILIYNNGQNRPEGTYSSVEEVVPAVSPDGTYMMPADTTPFGPAEALWTYIATPPQSFYSANISGVQRMPNGHTLICEGNRGRLFEVDNTGVIQWLYVTPVGFMGPLEQGLPPIQNNVFKVRRYAPSYSAFVDRDLTPGEPIELNPLPSECAIYTPVVEVAPISGVSLYPVPFSHHLYVKNANDIIFNVKIFDITGRLMCSTQASSHRLACEVSGWPKGLYTALIVDERTNRHYTQKIIKL